MTTLAQDQEREPAPSIGPRACSASAYPHRVASAEGQWYVLWHDADDSGVAGYRLNSDQMRRLLAAIRGTDALSPQQPPPAPGDSRGSSA